MSEQPVRVLIADDHTIVRHGLRLMLEQKEGITVVAEARDGLEAVALADSLKPDVILMDLEMPRMDGIQAAAAIHAAHPEIHILVLTSFTESEKITAALKNGAAGYFLKDTPPADLVRGIREVSQGNVSLPQAVAEKLVHGMQHTPASQPSSAGLTQRELEVLRMAARGLSNTEIAEKMVVSEGTVRFHFSNIFNKLGVGSRSQAIVAALRQGLVQLDERS